MILKVGTNTREIEDDGNTGGTENRCLSNPASLQDRGRMEDACRDDDLPRSSHVEELIVNERANLDQRRPAVAAVGIHDPDDLVLDEQIVVWPGGVEVVAKSGVGAAGRNGVLGDGNPAKSSLVAASAFLERGGSQVGPGAPNDVVIAPEEGREAGIDGC